MASLVNRFSLSFLAFELSRRFEGSQPLPMQEVAPLNRPSTMLRFASAENGKTDMLRVYASLFKRRGGPLISVGVLGLPSLPGMESKLESAVSRSRKDFRLSQLRIVGTTGAPEMSMIIALL
jgi:hypothetical protein